MNRYLSLFFLLVSLIITCSQGVREEPSQNVNTYYSGVNLNFEDDFIDREGLFFDDFDEIPEHTDPADYKEGTRYSYHSLVEKEEDYRFPKNNSLEIVEGHGATYLKSRLSPGQLHKKIKGYRAEMTLHGGNPDLKEEWYEWRFMIPEDYTLDDKNRGREACFVQFHYVQPIGEKKIINSPTIMFTYMEQYAKNTLLLRYGINGEDTGRFKDHRFKLIAVDDGIEKGKWYTLRVNINWSRTNQGYIAAWLNGEPFTPFNGIHNKVYGANMYNDIENTLKFGFYRYWDNSTPTSIYFDYLVKTRSFRELTGKDPTALELYGNPDDKRYLERKKRPLRNKHTKPVLTNVGQIP